MSPLRAVSVASMRREAGAAGVPLIFLMVPTTFSTRSSRTAIRASWASALVTRVVSSVIRAARLGDLARERVRRERGLGRPADRGLEHGLGGVVVLRLLLGGGEPGGGGAGARELARGGGHLGDLFGVHLFLLVGVAAGIAGLVESEEPL